MQSYRHKHTHTHTCNQAHTLIHTNRTLSQSSEQHPPAGRGEVRKVWTDTDYWLGGAESPTSVGGNSWIQRREGLLRKTSYWPENNDMADITSNITSGKGSLKDPLLSSGLSPLEILQST